MGVCFTHGSLITIRSRYYFFLNTFSWEFHCYFFYIMCYISSEVSEYALRFSTVVGFEQRTLPEKVYEECSGRLSENANCIGRSNTTGLKPFPTRDSWADRVPTLISPIFPNTDSCVSGGSTTIGNCLVLGSRTRCQ